MTKRDVWCASKTFTYNKSESSWWSREFKAHRTAHWKMQRGKEKRPAHTNGTHPRWPNNATTILVPTQQKLPMTNNKIHLKLRFKKCKYHRPVCEDFPPWWTWTWRGVGLVLRWAIKLSEKVTSKHPHSQNPKMQLQCIRMTNGTNHTTAMLPISKGKTLRFLLVW